MMVIDLRNRIIEEGIASVKKHEKRPERLRGGIIGFNLCRELDTPQDFERILQERHKVEHDMARTRNTEGGDEDLSAYWEHRYATVQIEFVWERLKVAWSIGPNFSAIAAIHVNRLMKGS